MKKLALLLAAAAMVAFAGSAMAQSAKFAAGWSNDVKFVQAVEADPNTTPTCTNSDNTAACFIAEVLLTTIDVPQWKDLLIGVSAQIGLVTFTEAKGKSTDTSLASATAEAGVDVTLELREATGSGTGTLVQYAAPGKVTFASRMQVLKVGVTDSDPDNLTTVTVSLLLDTTAAHHFNFIGVDLDQGDYDVVAVFDLSAFAEVVGEDSLAEARVILGPRMVTVQEVRAVRGSLDAVTQCNDNIDNDLDGKIDFGDDPGCTSLDDNDEAR